jgi:hypothetical protein
MSFIPNLFLIGVPRSGTTFLSQVVAGHQCCSCPIKEPGFFDRKVLCDDHHRFKLDSFDEYEKIYENLNSKNFQYVLDASIFSFYDPSIIKEMLAVRPQAKFILCLRDPLEAAKSMFRWRHCSSDKTKREITNDFCEAWRYLPQRRERKRLPANCSSPILFQYDLLYQYELYFRSVTNLIPDGNLFIVKYSDLCSRTNDVFEWLRQFLALDTSFAQIGAVNSALPTQLDWRSRVLSSIVTASSDARRSIGLYGHRVNWLKDLMDRLKHRQQLSLQGRCESDCIKHFRETYELLSVVDTGVWC